MPRWGCDARFAPAHTVVTTPWCGGVAFAGVRGELTEDANALETGDAVRIALDVTIVPQA